jgi:hypothetical protein
LFGTQSGCGATSLVSRNAFRHDQREFSSAPLAGVKPIRDFAADEVVIRGAALPR